MMIEKDRIKKILLINLKYFGDLVVCSPVYKSLKEYFPESEITLVVRKGYGSILEFDKNIDNILEFDINSVRKLKGIKKIFSGIKFISRIRSFKFNMVLTFHPSDRAAIWSFFSGAKYRIGYSDQSFNYFFNIKIPSIEETKNYLEYYLDTLRSIDVPIIEKKTYFMLDEKQDDSAEKYFNANSSEREIVVGINPGASREDKIWSLEKYAHLANLLAKKNIRVMIFKGPDDETMIAGIKKNLVSDNILIVDASRSLLYLGSLIKRCALLVCNDSVASHISKALEIKTITLMSREKIHCWKIYDGGKDFQYIIGDKCGECQSNICKGGKCLKDIPVSTVFNKVMECLNVE